jgi:quinol monooxygenase YgiN
MSQSAMYGKVIAQPGQRDAVVELLLEASRLLMPLAGCYLYVVNVMVVPSEPDAVWVTEIWATQADHDASLQMDSLKELIVRARPFIAGLESVR